MCLMSVGEVVIVCVGYWILGVGCVGGIHIIVR